MNPRRFGVPGLCAAILTAALPFALFAPSARGDDGEKRGGPPAHAKGRHGADGRRAAWKSLRSTLKSPQAVEGVAATPIVGRASMVINGAGTVAYTQNFLGNSTSNCDADNKNSAQWVPSTAHALHDHVIPFDTFGGVKFMAQNAGTTGITEPAWPGAFGGTVVDGTITWVNVGQNWAPGLAYTVGMVVESINPDTYHQGSLFQVTVAGTSGGSSPAWPIVAGQTVVDGGVTWKAIGFYPGAFTGCNAMQIVSRASGGAETVIAREGDAIGASGEQLMGWSEFLAMNASGKVAFRAESAGFLRNDDESPSGIFTAGPGAGALTKIASSNSTIGGRHMCGFSAMAGINAAGQVIFDGYAREHQETWQPNHVFPTNRTYPTVPNSLVFTSGGGTSGAVEPVWPTVPGRTIVDGTITWTSAAEDCDENDHSLVLNTGGVNALLVAQGSTVGGSTVIGFGSDDNSQPTGTCGFRVCVYENIEGFLNASGHTAVVLNLLDGTQGAFTFTGPGASTQVARIGVAGVTAIGPRTSINDSDQVVYRATSGGVDHLFRFTPPATTVTIVSVGDVVNGHTISSIQAFSDINNSGNVVFAANYNGDSNSAFYYWDGANTEVASGGTTDPLQMSSEMITVNNSNLVAYVTGSTGTPDETDGGNEDFEDGGIFFWTKGGGSTKAIAVGDNVAGDIVTTVYAQHTSFARRQLSSAGCVATAYHVLDDDPGFDCDEGGTTRSSPCGDPFNKGGQLFISCGAACPVITLAPPTLPGGTQNSPYSQQISASGGQAPYSFTETGALPTGITFTAGGLLSGTPTVTGSFPITVTATDANSCTGVQGYTLIIGSPTQETIVINPPSRIVTVGTSSTLSITINIAQPSDTIVTLTSSDPNIASVPATATIPANQLTGTFLVTANNVGGPITITAALPPSFGAVPATASITVVAGAVASVPTLNGLGLALLAGILALAGFLLAKLRS